MEELNKKVCSNDLILDCIFGFSNLDDIKRFRQVCRQWNNVAIPFVKSSSLISFKKPQFSLQRFNQLFQHSRLGTKFTAVKWTNEKTVMSTDDEECDEEKQFWETNELTQILEHHRISMKELTIDSTISHYREKFDLTRYIEPNLAKLNIQHGGMIISTDHCISTNFLRLRNCHLRIVDGTKINPIELVLDNVEIRPDDNAKISSINDLVNFDRLKSISIGLLRYKETIPSLHLSSFYWPFHFRDSVTVKTVHLFGLTMKLDFENAKWKVSEMLSLIEVDFTKRNQMEICHLQFVGADLDLAVLPTNLKTLEIIDGRGYIKDTEVLCSNPIYLPELRFLHLRSQNKFSILNEPEMQYLSHFTNCNNLTTLMLTFTSGKPDYGQPCKFDIRLLPRSVQKLYIRGNIVFYGEIHDFELKRLNIQQSNGDSLFTILSRFKGEILDVDLRGTRYAVHAVIGISEMPFETTTVAFNYEKSDLHPNQTCICKLSKCTDKLSNFYIFVNKFGNAISESKFEERFALGEKMNEEAGQVFRDSSWVEDLDFFENT